MIRLFGLVAVCLLFASLVGGSILHAADIPGADHIASESQSVHVDGDHDPMPAKGDGGAPDHHAICHGHDLPTPIDVRGRSAIAMSAMILCPAADAPPASGPPVRMLRPPIA